MNPTTVRRAIGVAVSCLALIAASSVPSRAAVSLPTDFVDEVVASGFSTPSSFAFLPDGRVLVTEQRTGNVRLVVNGAATPPIFTVPSLNSSANERGLLSVAVDPQWPQRPYVYFFYTRTGAAERLVRYTASGDLAVANSSNLTLGSAYLVMDDLVDDASNHNGGTLRFDDDGYLYLSLGEDADPCSAQDPSRLKGVVLRLAVAGLPAGAGGPATRAEITPADNPFAASSDANTRLVFAYGLRNPFRFALDPVTGKLYVGDVGDVTWEEIDEVQAGDNLGWPHREGFANHGTGCTPPGGFAPKAPIAAYDHGDGVAIMGAGPYRPAPGAVANWPSEYWGDVFYADYYTGFMRRISWSGASWGAAPAPGQPNGTDWATGLPSPVDFHVGPDGGLWWVSQGGGLHRIRYAGVAVGVDDDKPALGGIRATSPFTGATEISFALARAGRARLAVHDIGGRRVRTLVDADLGAGARRIVWDGNDDEGRPAPSGMYLVRLDHPDGRSVTRALKLR